MIVIIKFKCHLRVVYAKPLSNFPTKILLLKRKTPFTFSVRRDRAFDILQPQNLVWPLSHSRSETNGSRAQLSDSSQGADLLNTILSINRSAVNSVASCSYKGHLQEQSICGDMQEVS